MVTIAQQLAQLQADRDLLADILVSKGIEASHLETLTQLIPKVAMLPEFVGDPSKSILDTIKKMLGIHKDDDTFDIDIIVGINSAFTTLRQLGVGPEAGFSIVDDTKLWTDFIPESERLDAVKTYIYLKVKLVFDPPLNASLLESFETTIKELEWRLNVAAETK